MSNIYGVTGMPLAGKTTVARFLEDEGFGVLDMGEVVRTEMEKREKDVSETGEFVRSMREQNGQDAIAQMSIPYLEEILDKKEKVVITGMRSWEEKKRFETEAEVNIEIIAVWASRSKRRERREKRQREEDVKGDAFSERDLREIDHGVGKLMALSDHMIKNNTINEEKLHEKITETIA